MNLQPLSQVKYLRYFEVTEAFQAYTHKLPHETFRIAENKFEDHVLLDEKQVEDLLKDAPEQFKARFDGYTMLDQLLVEKSNAVEEVALNYLLNKILTPKLEVKVVFGVLKLCSNLVDNRIIEVFLRQKLNSDTCTYIDAFATACELKSLIEFCDKWKSERTLHAI